MAIGADAKHDNIEWISWELFFVLIKAFVDWKGCVEEMKMFGVDGLLNQFVIGLFVGGWDISFIDLEKVGFWKLWESFVDWSRSGAAAECNGST